MYQALGPLEGDGMLVSGCGEGINGAAYIAHRGRVETLEGCPSENAEPDLHLIEPGSMGGSVVKVDQGMAGQPPVVFGLVRVQVVHDHVQLAVGIMRHELVHEVQELTASASGVVASVHESRGHLQGSKEGRGAMPFVFMAKPSQGLPTGEPEPALRPLQRLDGWLLVHAQHHGVLRRVQVECHNVGGLGGELRVRADTPTPPSPQVNATLPEHAPHLIG